jgi:hypothetical protein
MHTFVLVLFLALGCKEEVKPPVEEVVPHIRVEMKASEEVDASQIGAKLTEQLAAEEAPPVAIDAATRMMAVKEVQKAIGDEASLTLRHRILHRQIVGSLFLQGEKGTATVALMGPPKGKMGRLSIDVGGKTIEVD